ncbi:deacetylase protein [Rutstroemia sp. NJR-2017a BVV2]|nr:deacetylase protein [Rutstroemia sp. NJR-2017a BVV2]
MARQRKEKETKFKLKQPDRSGPDPSVETLLEIAQKRGLAKAQQDRQAELDAEGEEILIGRLGDSILWTISLTMLHFTLDVLVTHQYAVDLVWRDIVSRTAQAFPGMLYYTF